MAISDQDPYVVSDEVSEDYYFADQFADQAGAAPGEERFFNATDEELEQWSKGVVKLERKRRSVGLKVLLVIILIVVALLGAGLFLYTQGYGFPTQEAVITQLFDNPQASGVYANGITEDDVKDMAALIPEGSTVTIDGMNKTMSTTTAYATGTTPQGGNITYEISLVRDMIGWKVSNVDLYFASEN